MCLNFVFKQLNIIGRIKDISFQPTYFAKTPYSNQLSSKKMKISFDGRLFKKIMKTAKKRQQQRNLKIDAVKTSIFRTENNQICIRTHLEEFDRYLLLR